MLRTVKTLSTAFAFALLLAAAGPAAADPACRTLHGWFEVQITGGPDCESPIDLCGTVKWQGSLRADSAFIATSLITTDDTPATGVVVVTGDNVLVTTDGEIFTKDAILLAATGEFTEIDTVVGGTGEFAGATGSIIATGFSTGPEAEGSFVGEICWP